MSRWRDRLAVPLTVRVRRKAGILVALRTIGDRPLTAVDLAYMCGIEGMKRESQRRRVRELVEELHRDGYRICAGKDADRNQAGYWLARNDGEWAAYKAARRAEKVFDFVRLRRMSAAARDRTVGQGKLF